MNKFLIFALIITSNFILTSSYGQNTTNEDVQGIWNGTVTLVEKYSGSIGTSERHIDLKVIDNRVTGTHKYVATATEGGHNECFGNGDGELHILTIRDWDSTYDIHIITPECNGNNAGTSGTDIVISNQKLSKNHNILSGTETRVSDLGEILGKGTSTTTWNLVRSQSDAELIVTPVDYDKWLPEPGANEFLNGTVMSVALKLQGKNGKPLKAKVKQFDIRLINTSSEPGITINYPLQPANPSLPDLRFMPQPGAQIEDDFQVMKISCTNCTTANLKIGSYDGGGYTTLIAIAILDDESRITGNLKVPGGITEIPVPKRNGSMIGEFWFNAHGKPGDYDDKETSKGNNHDGDGLTAYEEYRGVISEGHFKRLDPEKKELGVTLDRSLFSEFNEGISWFESASDIKIVRFFYNMEIATDRRFNKNYSQGHVYDQDVLRLIKAKFTGSLAGKAFTISDKPELPINTTVIAISTDNIRQNYQNWTKWAKDNNLQLRWTEKEYLAQTIAHEMGHGVKVSHHGDGGAPQGETAQQNSRPVYHVFDRNAVEITTRPYTIDKNDNVCPAGESQASGDLSCVMAYIDVCDWARIVYKDGSIGLFQSPLLPIGRNFCTQKDGTGINSGFHTVSGVSYNNYFGKAENGQCRGQITLK